MSLQIQRKAKMATPRFRHVIRLLLMICTLENLQAFEASTNKNMISNNTTNTIPSTSSIDDSTTVSNVFKKNNLDSRIIGGSLAPPHVYPWFARLVIKGETYCGGSLVSSEYVLTAAHCVERGGAFTIEVGRLCYNSGDNCGQKIEAFEAERISMHPSYSQNGWNNDFALIKLSGTSSISPVALDESDLSWTYSNDKILVAAGFGTKDPKGDSYPDKLLHTELFYLPQQECSRKPGYGHLLKNSMMCAIGKNHDSCYGDSGGPLFDPVTETLIGLISWGYGCMSGKPGVYARVATQVNWIKGIICSSNSSPQPVFCGGRKEGCTNPKQQLVEVEIITDAYGSADNSFTIFKRDYGEFTKKRFEQKKLGGSSSIRKSKCLNKTKCYKLIVYDSYGDGMCCDYGQGSYKILWNGKLIKESAFKGGQEEESPTFGNC